MSDKILFFHANCPDGFGAAYAFWKKFGNSITYYPISHGDPVPNVNRKEVFMADIAFDREVMLRVAGQADRMVVLDHHVSKYDELKDLEFYTYSDKHSGAMMAWKYLFPEEDAPPIIKYVETRDLWKWELDNAHEILSALDSINFNFKEWDGFNELLKTNPELVITKGSAILGYCETLMNRIIRDAHTIEIRGVTVPAVNTPFFRSEILSRLCQDAPFSAGYHYDGERVVFSLRSTDAGMDVAEIAATFPGGGGHRNAAGFSVSSLSELNIQEEPKTNTDSWTYKLWKLLS